MAANQPLVDLVSRVAAKKEATPAQVSLAWMLAKEDFIAPIPGSREAKYIREHLGAADVELTAEDLADLEAEHVKVAVHGNRTDADIARLTPSSNHSRQAANNPFRS